MRLLPILALALTILGGCDDEAPAPTPDPAAPAAEEAAGQVEEAPAAADPAPEPEAEPVVEETPPVDLLHAVATIVATSSVYDEDIPQIERLFDGDLETAWNAESGKMVGTFIEVELPADVEVTGIEMTAGYTKESGDRDLFTMNYRIGRVRVRRGHETLAEQALDIDERGLQTIPFSTTGGVLRIELDGVTPGSREDWRELCVSELRVMGRAPNASADPLTPEVTLGAIYGPDLLNPAWEDYQAAVRANAELRAADPEAPESDRHVERTAFDYSRGWVRALLEQCNMPRLEEGWNDVSRRYRRTIDQYTPLARRIEKLEAKIEAGEASDRETNRLSQFEERIGRLADVLDRTGSQLNDLAAQMQEHMCRVDGEDAMNGIQPPPI